MKVERIGPYNPNPRYQRLFYIAENENSSEIVVHCYSPQDERQDQVLTLLEPGIYYFNFYFKTFGKYLFIIFEDGIKKLMRITTIS